MFLLIVGVFCIEKYQILKICIPTIMKKMYAVKRVLDIMTASF